MRSTSKKSKCNFNGVSIKEDLLCYDKLSTYFKELIHEIKNPLDIIKAHAAYLIKNKGRSPMENDEYLSVIIDEVERLTKFLEEFAECYQKMKLDLSLCGINDIIDKVLAKMVHEFNEKHVELNKDLKRGLPKARIDEAKMCQALVNILKNAVDAVDEGGKINITSSFKDGFIIIAIRDNGAGIKKDEIQRVFEPFFTTKQGGSGFGLHISRKIVEAHRGSLSVSSVYKEGAEFVINLPLREGKEE